MRCTGEVYPVIEIVAGFGTSQLRVLDSDRITPGLWPHAMFETVESSVPRNWIARVDERGLTIGPRDWVGEGFWEAFFDREPGAMNVYERELETILGESAPAD